MDAANLFDQALEAISAEDLARARELLLRLVALDPDHEQAWQWLSSLATSSSERIAALEQVLRLSPDNQVARQSLERLKARQADRAHRQADPPVSPARRSGYGASGYLEEDNRPVKPPPKKRADGTGAGQPGRRPQKAAPTGNALEQGQLLEKQGDLEGAIYHYIEASQQARTLAQRLNARRCLEQAQLRIDAPHYRPTPSAYIVVRLVMTPALLFLLLVLLENGLGFYLAVPFTALGLASILSGSALLALTTTMPLLVEWFVWWERYTSGDGRLSRPFAWLAGLTLVTAPYIVLASYSLTRLWQSAADVLK
jgi:tetratricopeptide (TPR) repeat protein